MIAAIVIVIIAAVLVSLFAYPRVVCVAEQPNPECMTLAKNDINECMPLPESFASQPGYTGTTRGDCTNNYYLMSQFASRDKSLCNNINDDYIKTGCLAIAEGSTAFCDGLGTSDLKNTCLAIVNSDISLCNNIADTKTSSDCKDLVSVKAAVDGGSPSLCDSATSDGMKLYCKALITQDESYCKEKGYIDCVRWESKSLGLPF